MKTIKQTFTLFISLVILSTVSAQEFKAEDLVGTWLTSDGSGLINIYEESGKYFAKSTSATDPEGDKTKKDTNNADKERQNTLLVDVFILKDFEYDEDGEWDDGTIYDPADGKTYKCVIEMTDKNTIEVTGYVGITLFGRTENWTRTN